MFNAVFSALGLEAVYVPVDVEAHALADLMRGFCAAHISGNITVPHKVQTADLVTRETDLARDLQAVNTFWVEDGVLVGDNTDVAGVLDALDFLDAGGPWLVAGTGGSARAVAAAARSMDVPLVVQSRDSERAAAFVSWARHLGVDAHPDDGRQIGTAINATPRGMHPADAVPIAMDRLDGTEAVLDLVYARGETAWCRAARARDMRASDGRRVLVGQGIRAFERFYPGMSPPLDVMRAAVDRSLQ